MDSPIIKAILGILMGFAALAAWGGFLWLLSELPKIIRNNKEAAKKKQYEQVTACSSKYRQLLELISASQVYVIPASFHVERIYNSRKSLDNAKAKEVIISLANSNAELKKLYSNLTINRKKRKEFLSAVTLIGETRKELVASCNMPESRFYEIENEMFQAMVDSIREDTSIVIDLRYRTPKGAYLYTKTLRTDYQGLTDAYAESGRREAARLAREDERAKLTASLRYDVMQRDKFRCVLCGATQADGAKLHVDHIRPVSKGGKTEMRNLRTLCDRCNLGKSDKYNVNGIN